MTTRLPLAATSLLLLPLLMGSAVPQPVARMECRDATGEPTPCVVSSPPAPPTEPSSGHTHRDRELGYVNVYPFLDVSDVSSVRFAPESPSSVPDVERGSHVTGIAPGFDRPIGGLALGFGYRPVPWLRLPDVSFAFGYGDFSSTSVAIEGGGQSLTGSMHDLWMARAQIGGGVDLDFDPVRIFALAHIGVGGYFAQLDVGGSSIGGLGSDTYSAVSLEAGWTLGMEVELTSEVAYTFGYRHVHTGVEQNSVFFGVNVRFEE